MFLNFFKAYIVKSKDLHYKVRKFGFFGTQELYEWGDEVRWIDTIIIRGSEFLSYEKAQKALNKIEKKENFAREIDKHRNRRFN